MLLFTRRRLGNATRGLLRGTALALLFLLPFRLLGLPSLLGASLLLQPRALLLGCTTPCLSLGGDGACSFLRQQSIRIERGLALIGA